ncbi:unnamed protein product, partial [Polarella glacialis]
AACLLPVIEEAWATQDNTDNNNSNNHNTWITVPRGTEVQHGNWLLHECFNRR